MLRASCEIWPAPELAQDPGAASRPKDFRLVGMVTALPVSGYISELRPFRYNCSDAQGCRRAGLNFVLDRTFGIVLSDAAMAQSIAVFYRELRLLLVTVVLEAVMNFC
jgi:hypothetical protein